MSLVLMHVYMCDLEALCYLSISTHLSETAGGVERDGKGGGEKWREINEKARVIFNRENMGDQTTYEKHKKEYLNTQKQNNMK